MTIKYTYLIAFLLFAQALSAQNILVQPYLQDATPSSIRVMWETDGDVESIVEYGLSSDLGNEATGIAIPSNGDNLIHDVSITGLERFTIYYYRVKTGNATSEIFSFKTPPFASDEQSFNLLAMSDMQKDGNNVNKFQEVVQAGVIPYMTENYPGNLEDHLGLVLIPGDLVVTGNDYASWRTDFFNPAHPLFAQVPVYPVLGNHENNTVNYFNYFHTPENGSPGYEEHWWFADHSNIRVIGLNSNPPYDNGDQLAWLETVLNETCQLDSIDFVFAELHHPHKSELWVPGESDFTGEVIALLESFTTDCGKPSIHFFGHTHGYSRGQSQDHKHLWVNVATAGGAIDNWGEFPNFDYDEFTVTQDEYGFVVVEVEAGDNPAFTLKRISRGNQYIFRANELRDSLTVYRYATAPDLPEPLFPINEVVSPDCVILEAKDFNSPLSQGVHGASQWQVALDCDFTTPVYDSWQQFENWYFMVDTQDGIILSEERVTNLQEYSNYCWRVRFRDKELNWSAWTEAVPFETSASEITPNLLINPGAEEDVTGWEVIDAPLEILTDGECDGISPHSGTNYFAVGGVCEDGPFGESRQLVDLLSYADEINAGVWEVNFGGYLSDFNGSDLPEIQLYFLDENESILDSSLVIGNYNSNWTFYSEWSDIPVGCQFISYNIRGTRNAGSDNDSYFDDLFLSLGKVETDCSELLISNTGEVSQAIHFEVSPNPFDTVTQVEIRNKGSWTLLLSDQTGKPIRTYDGTGDSLIQLNRDGLPSGIYYLTLSIEGYYKSSKKIVITP